MSILYKIKFCNGDEKFIKIFNRIEAKNISLNNLLDMMTNPKDVKYISCFIGNKERILIEKMF